MISSDHCGNIERLLGVRRSSPLTGNVPFVLTGFILQRPFPIYELDVNSGNTIRAGAARANRSVRSDAVLVARQTNKATLGYLQRGEEGGSFSADIFSHCMFTFRHLTVRIDQLDSHIDGNVVPRVNALIR
jgi:hypothetical protein